MIPLIGDLLTLLELDVSGTSISGTMPSEVYTLPQLSFLNYDNTNIVGELLSPFSGAITHVSLCSTGVSGTLPDMSGAYKLNTLSIFGTVISGTVPASLTQQSEIERIYVYNTHISGTFPSVEMLHRVTEIDADSTCPHNPASGLSGTLPAGIENLHLAINLDFHDNKISGTIPYPISSAQDATSWRSLERLYLQDTLISGTVPALGCLSHLTKLDVHNSAITGFAAPISDPSYSCPSLPGSLTHLYVEGNPINMTGAAVSALLSPLDLNVLDFSFINIPVQLDCVDETCSGTDNGGHHNGGHSFGTRVGRPANGICYVGGACAF